MRRVTSFLFLFLVFFLEANPGQAFAFFFTWSDFDWKKNDFGNETKSDVGAWCDFGANRFAKPEQPDFEWKSEKDTDSFKGYGFEQDDNYFDWLPKNNGRDVPETEPIPEPASIILFGAGLLGVAGLKRKKMQNRYNKQ